ncbi:predicted protein [Nematostella vectensis]|uniref:Uncharacterized protein n=1 Tax=Nematostella vectensis TaxID=45351 RepID=A7S9V6_NEMVE|nr:uncharacterized protein LOC5511106 [Nematostella vectensis]EDO39491.1 predicted protein [Nematostella vectensis]|eukprot:XP_001631554.1 predicted protein [Nematostella vectensis]
MCIFNCIGKCIGGTCKCVGKSLMACLRGLCKCFCNPVSAAAGFFIQIFLYAGFQGFNIGTDVGIFLETTKTYAKCYELATTPIYLTNTTNTTDQIYCVNKLANATQSHLMDQLQILTILEGTFFFFICLSGAVYMVHIAVLFPNACRHWRDDNFENMLAEASPYYSKVLQIHTYFLLLESVIHDVPMSCLAIEMCAQMWGIGGINCWECASSLEALPAPHAQPGCEMWLGLLLGSIALVSIYKGILPLYAWIGNPFCWACYPLRICVVLPAGFLYCVLVLAPSMGVALNRLFLVEPLMRQEMGTYADTIWTFGLFFYGIIAIVCVVYWLLCGKCICVMCCECKKKDAKDGSAGCLCC